MGDTAAPLCIQAFQASFLQGALHSETSIVLSHPPPEKHTNTVKR